MARTCDIMINSHALLPTELWDIECMEMESNHRTRRNGFTVRRVWPLRYPCDVMTPSLRARAPPIYYERRTPRKHSCSTLLRCRARFKDRAGFEPADDFRRLRFSRPVFSTTQPSIRSRWVLRVHLTHLKSSFFTDAKSNVHGVRKLRE